MSTTTSTCENCGRTIGKLEQPYTWKESVVCLECSQRLRGQTPGATGEQLVDAIGTHVISPGNVRKLSTAGKAALLGLLVILVALAALMLFMHNR